MRLYPVRFRLIVLDLICWLVAILLMFTWRIIAVKSNTLEYILEYIVYSFVFIIVGAILGKYRPLRSTRFLYLIVSTLFTWFVVSLVIYFTHRYVDLDLSIRVAYLGLNIAMVLNMIYLLGFYFWRYAQYMEMEERPIAVNRECSAEVVSPSEKRPEREVKAMENSIEEYSNGKVLEYLKRIVPLDSTNTRVVANVDSFSIAKIPDYRYDTIVNLKLLNDIRGLNVHFCMVNEKLPDDGSFVCCFRPQRVIKDRIFQKFPKGFNIIVYSWFYLWYRIMPKLATTSRLYFDITGGKNRVLSITEVLGRLYYCGFEVEEEQFIGHIYYVKARRKHNPHPQSRSRRYGPLIKLSRIGKNGKKFNVYKMRTMHPYSEFLQKYVYDKVGLQEGGKMSNDMRVSTLGAFMRKYWLDELPMFINFFKGDMKFVGVRPLSSHYFSLYSKDLQEKRTKFKPGLFPPFYADMPKTLEDIQDSEMRYLVMCEKRGTFVTDIVYLWKIFVNIVFKKARSH